MDLSNHHIIITGGAGSLGTATVRLFLEHGASVSVPCFNREEYESFEHKDRSTVFTKVNVDLSNEKDTQDFFENSVNEYGPLWASIHIAGGFGMGSIEDSNLESFSKQFQINTVTCFNSCRTAVHWMRQSPHQGGRIVNVAARPALEPRQGKGMTAYTVSKAGVAALTQSLAAEVAKENIWVNAIAPSIIDTPANRRSMPDADYEDWPKPEEIATQILYLASPENSATRGAVIPVYGRS